MRFRKTFARGSMIDLGPEDLEGLFLRLEAGSLTQQDRRILKAIVEAYLLLSRALQEKSAKIKELLRMIFGVKTERAEALFGGNSKRGTKEKPEAAGKKTGHGRYGASSYTGAKKIPVSHPSLRREDSCPGCQRGKLYPLGAPGVSVRISAIAPLQAELFEREKLRCNLCGELFTAPLPEEAGQGKYDQSAGAMIALLKYGGGLPFNRIEQLQESLGIPVAASTQWDIVEKTADRIYPVHDELIRQAAQGEIIYNDDTRMKILALVPQSDGERSGSFTTGILSIVAEKKIVLFATGRKHAGENLNDLLAQRELRMGPPIQMCDALSRNPPEDFTTLLANCLVHKAVGQERGKIFGRIAGEGIAHLNGRTHPQLSLRQQIVQVFARVFSSGRKQDDLLLCDDREYPGGKAPASFAVALRDQCEYLHPGIIIVNDFTLGGLSDQFVMDGVNPVGRLLHDVPLRGGRNGDPQALLQLLDPVEGKPASVLEKRNHGPCALIVFSLTRLFGQGGREELPAQIAAKFLPLKKLCL